jgi:hypothetical protein
MISEHVHVETEAESKLQESDQSRMAPNHADILRTFHLWRSHLTFSRGLASFMAIGLTK